MTAGKPLARSLHTHVDPSARKPPGRTVDASEVHESPRSARTAVAAVRAKECVIVGTHESVKLATAAHLHVLLRRHTGRVTDVEWLTANEEYAAEIVRIAVAEAIRVKVPQLAECAEKFAHVLQPRADEVPALLGVRANAIGESLELRAAQQQEPDGPVNPESKYVGGIR